MLFDPADEHVGRSLALYGEYCSQQAELFEQIVQPGMLVMEIGPGIGAHTLPLARRIGADGLLLAIEPRHQFFPRLCANVAVNRLANVVCRQSPLLESPEAEEGGNGRPSIGAFLQRLADLDRVGSDEPDLPRCQFLKVNIELFNERLLPSIATTLRKHRPAFYIVNRGSPVGEEVLRLIDSWRYEIYSHSVPLYSPKNFRGSAQNVFGDLRLKNLICLPSGPRHQMVGFQKVAPPPPKEKTAARSGEPERQPDPLSPTAPPGTPPSLERLFDFEAIRAEAERIRRETRGPMPTPAAEVKGRFLEMLRSADCVSFDVFDTLLVRHVHEPTDVFFHLEQSEAFKALAPWPRPVHQLRREAEAKARQAAASTRGTMEVVLRQVYETLCQTLGLPVERAVALTAAEEAAEILLCKPNPELKDLFNLAVSSGKKVIVVSDTYHRRDFISRLLSSNGYLVLADRIFVSSEQGVNKRGGDLFRRVFEALKLPAESVLHVGDDAVSDLQSPQRKGMNALLHPFRPIGTRAAAGPDCAVARTESFVRSACSFEARCGPARDDFWWLFGYSAMGPLVTGFCQWLKARFAEDGIARAYFLLRDGEILSRIYQTLYAPGASPVRVETLYSSRRAFAFAALESAPSLAEATMSSGLGRQPVGEFLARLCLPARDFKDDIRACGFASPDELIDPAARRKDVKALLGRPRVLDALRARARQERRSLLGYLDGRGVFKEGRIATVDLGWNGSIQKALHALMQGTGSKQELVGYYLATMKRVNDFTPRGFRARGFLTNAGEPASVAKTINSFSELLEFACSSSEGSLWHFEQVNGQCAPKFKANTALPESLARLAAVHEGAVAFARNIRGSAATLGLGTIPAQVASENLLRVQSSPTKLESDLLGGLAHCDDMGSTVRRRPVAKFRDSLSTAKELLDDFENATWKAGLRNHRSAQGLALRTIQWMLDG